ncbi:cation efflux family protein [Mycobacterium xenopi 4042]|uniref:Cation efflux family protein n=1 Tax=Mycobacterium xenopi 4042 TaxID=1299334 RepID=X8DMC3_MYCXE|nr:cation efflux family protein [Mycobacterium xenopi 4042]
MLLIGIAAFILYEAVRRLGDAPAIPGVPLTAVALGGLATNTAVALLLRSQSTRSLAVKAPTPRSSPTR